MTRPLRRSDPFAALAPLLSAVEKAPLPPSLFVSGDDDWIVAEAARRVASRFRERFPEGEVSEHEAAGTGVKDAVADAATVALFSTNRLVVLDGTELFRTKKLTADEVDALLDEAAEAGLDAPPGAAADRRALDRLARKARALATAAGVELADDPADAARRLTGRVKRSDRAPEFAALLSRALEEGEAPETGADRLVDYLARATSGDNALLVFALSPDPEHRATKALRRAFACDLSAPDDAARRDRLAALGLERAVERNVTVDTEVFETLTGRGRLAARPFLLELDRLVDAAPAGRVTAEAAARLVVDEKKEYGSDFVEAVAGRRFLDALRLAEKLLSSDDFTAFRPFGEKGKDDAPARKGPRGDAAFFPLLGLLAGDVRRMLALKAAQGPDARRTDYRTFADRVLPALKSPKAGAAPLGVDGHPFVLHKAFLAAFDWTLDELADALVDLAAIDRGVKSGAGTGPELLESFLLARAIRTAPARRAPARDRAERNASPSA